MSYPLGMSPAEIDRLGRQHETWRGPTEGVWRLAGFRAGQTIVDLGCGPGFTSLDLAAIAGPAGRVVAIDASSTATNYLSAAAAGAGVRNLTVVTAEAGACDLAEWRPDAVFARWLFCYLPSPATVLDSLAAVLVRGGVVAVIDYWHYLALRIEPESATFTRVFRAVYDSFRDNGGSLDVAGALPALLARTGFAVRHVEPLCQVGRPGSPIWTWIADFQTIYLPTLVARGYLTREDVDEYAAWWAEQAVNPDAFVFAPPMLAVVAEKR
jgi:SAM-dependent methyltransferase